MILIGDFYHEVLTRVAEMVSSTDCCTCGTTDSYPDFDSNYYLEYVTDDIQDFDIIYQRTNDFDAQWVLREMPYPDIRFLLVMVPQAFNRRMMRCNRKGIGLRIRQ